MAFIFYKKKKRLSNDVSFFSRKFMTVSVGYSFWHKAILFGLFYINRVLDFKNSEVKINR